MTESENQKRGFEYAVALWFVIIVVSVLALLVSHSPWWLYLGGFPIGVLFAHHKFAHWTDFCTAMSEKAEGKSLWLQRLSWVILLAVIVGVPIIERNFGSTVGEIIDLAFSIVWSGYAGYFFIWPVWLYSQRGEPI